jgi:hypothetical protein
MLLMIQHLQTQIPADLRERLEAARLELLALFRALDQMDLSPEEIPQGLMHALFELDADYAEALWALDQPPGRIDFRAMVRDTLASLEQLPRTSKRFRKNLAPRAHPDLENIERLIRPSLNPKEAYNMIPDRDPKAR